MFNFRDDTLLCSSFLSKNECNLDTKESDMIKYKSGLIELEQFIIALIEKALSRGMVNIVTNAETGWVELSAKKFVPGVIPFLQQVNVFSARSLYEYRFPNSPLLWKFHCFKERLDLILKNEHKWKNIISMGDSHVEREAIRSVSNEYLNIHTKSIKFSDRPSQDQLKKQIELIIKCFDHICNFNGPLDLQLKVSN